MFSFKLEVGPGIDSVSISLFSSPRDSCRQILPFSLSSCPDETQLVMGVDIELPSVRLVDHRARSRVFSPKQTLPLGSVPGMVLVDMSVRFDWASRAAAVSLLTGDGSTQAEWALLLVDGPLTDLDVTGIDLDVRVGNVTGEKSATVLQVSLAGELRPTGLDVGAATGASVSVGVLVVGLLMFSM